MDRDINIFGLTNFRNQQTQFGIRRDDRRRHFYIIGQTGTGKTTLMENMVKTDITNGEGLAIIDPHGEFADKMLNYIPPSRINDVVYINPADLNWPVAFNVIEDVPPEIRYLIASGLMGVFKKTWPDVWSSRMEYILNNTLMALLEYPGSTLLGINRMLSDSAYRQEVIKHINDPIIKAFWTVEFAKYNERYASEAIAPIQNKAGQFTSNPLIRNIIGQKESKIDMRAIMDEGKILIVNLSKGLIGEDNSALLGALIITKLQQAAMSRVDIPENERKDFYLYVDEFQSFSTESFASILSEARKYRLNLILAHQYITQLNEVVRDAVFGNVGTLAVYRIFSEDAEFLEQEFAPNFTAQDLVSMPNYNFCLRLMIDGFPSKPFTAMNIPPIAPETTSSRDEIIDLCRQKFSRSAEEVKLEIGHWAALDFGPTPEKNSGKKIDFYPATCNLCHQQTEVPFKPDNQRPVYCKACLEKIKSGEVIPPTLVPRVDSEMKKPKSNLPKNKPNKTTLVNEEALSSAISQALNKTLGKKDVEEDQNINP